MVGGLIRLAGILMCIVCMICVGGGFLDGPGLGTALAAMGVLVGLVLFAVGRIVADLFTPRRE
jgi:hypothetical protein